MDKASSKVAVPPASAPNAQPSAPAAAEDSLYPGALLALAFLLRVFVVALMAGGVTRAAWRARHDPEDLAFIAGPAVLLGSLFLCLRRAERLAPDSPPAARRRLQAAVWALTTAISGIFACRVAAAMPPALDTLVWCMTAAVVIAGFYMLVLSKDRQEYQALDGVDCDAAAGDHGKASNKLRPIDELV